MTSYLPNLGPTLKDAIQPDPENEDPTLPRMGVAHFGDDPEWAVQNIDKRMVPLGYVDRKYAYRLSMGTDGTKRLRPPEYRLDGTPPNEKVYEPPDASSVDLVFTSAGPGPLVLCEPPCFSDNCAKLRRMPMIQHVSLELDGAELKVPNHEKTSPAEVTGVFCKIIATEVSEGNHLLRIKTLTKYPYYVMISHVISFS